MANEVIIAYANLVKRGQLSIDQVPSEIREQVQEELDKQVELPKEE